MNHETRPQPTCHLAALIAAQTGLCLRQSARWQDLRNEKGQPRLNHVLLLHPTDVDAACMYTVHTM